MPYTPWPASLPQVPKRRGFQRDTKSSVAIFQPEVGPAKRRQRGTASGKLQSMLFIIHTSLVPVFEVFYKDDLKDGALPFLWQSPLDDEAAGWVFNPENPYSLSTPARYTWELSINIERLP